MALVQLLVDPLRRFRNHAGYCERISEKVPSEPPRAPDAYTALLLALALTTSLFVNWQLHGVGIAKTADYLCGELEHEHTAACYEKQLVCGYEEGEPEDWNATMTDDGMSFDDTFDMDDDAFGVDADDPGIATYSAEPEYIFVPHEHTDDCYQEVRELTCLEESTPTTTAVLMRMVSPSSAINSSTPTTTAATPPPMSWCAVWKRASL